MDIQKISYALIAFWLLVPYSFAQTSSDISEEQVILEMNQYLDHLNGSNNSEPKHSYQLELLTKIKPLWKLPEFRELRAKPLSELKTLHSNDSFYLSALAFHDEDISTSQTPSNDDDLVNRAIRFREELRGGDGFKRFERFDLMGAIDDFGFNADSSMLLTLSHRISLDANDPIGQIESHRKFHYLDTSAPHENRILPWFGEPRSVNQSNSRFLEDTYIYIGEGSERFLKITYVKPDEEEYERYDISKSFVSFSVSYDHSLLAWLDGGHNIQLLHLITFVKRSIPCSVDDEITAIAFSPNEHILAWGTSSGSIHTYNLETNETHRKKTLGGLPITDLAIHPNPNIVSYLCLGGAMVHTINMITGEKQKDIESHLNRISNIQTSRQGDLLVESVDNTHFPEGFPDATIEIFNENGTRLFSHRYCQDDFPRKIEFSADGAWMAILSDDYRLKLYQKGSPVLSLDLLMLIDPDKVTPSATGSGGGR